MTRSTRDVAIFVQARCGSRRCCNKMLRPFAGTTLIDICLDKLATITGYDVYFGAHEAPLLEKARARTGFEIVVRSRESAESHSDPRVIFEMLKKIPQPYVCWINPCHPMLEMDTVVGGVEAFAASDARAMTSVTLRKGWFYTPDGRALTNLAVKADTSQADGLFEVAHAFHIYERERMLEQGKPWDNVPGDPRLYEIPSAQAHDIDTEEEFVMVEALYRHNLNMKRTNQI